MSRWANKIVRTGEIDPTELLAHPENVKVHPKEQLDAMEAVLRTIGWTQEIIVSLRTGYVLDGHLRVLLALQKNERTVPAAWVDVDEEEERLALALINRTPHLAALNPQRLEAVLRLCQTDEPTIAKMLSAFAEASGLLAQPLPIGESPGMGPADEPPPEPAHEPKPIRLRVGDHQMEVSVESYAAWVQALRARVGRSQSAGNTEIRRRLGII